MKKTSPFKAELDKIFSKDELVPEHMSTLEEDIQRKMRQTRRALEYACENIAELDVLVAIKERDSNSGAITQEGNTVIDVATGKTLHYIGDTFEKHDVEPTRRSRRASKIAENRVALQIARKKKN